MTDRSNRKKAAFLESLATGVSVRCAARLATISLETLYLHRKKYPEFAAAWDEALEEGIDCVIDEARRRAVEGNRKPMVHQGKIVEYYPPGKLPGFDAPEQIWLYEQSDACLFWWAKQRDRERFDDAIVRLKYERKWNKEDGKPDAGLSASEQVLAAFAELAAKLAAKPANAT